MIPLKKDKIFSLQTWPSPKQSPGYRVIEGDPQVSGCLEIGSNQSQQRLGIWACSKGTFECIESGNELQTVIEGCLRVIQEDGTAIEYSPGDSFYTKKGEKLIWEILEPVKKVFFNFNEQGKP